MAKTLTLSLEDRAVTAFAHLQGAGIDVGRFIESAIIDEAARVRGRALLAAEQLDRARGRLDLDEVRDIPHQIDYVRPPR